MVEIWQLTLAKSILLATIITLITGVILACADTINHSSAWYLKPIQGCYQLGDTLMYWLSSVFGLNDKKDESS